MKNYDWNYKFKILKEYIDENNCLPPSDYVYKNIRIGSWYKRQLCYIKDKYKDDDGNYRYKTIYISKNQSELLLSLISKFQYNRLTFEEIVGFCNDYLIENNLDYIDLNAEYNGYKIGKWSYQNKFIINNGVKQENGDIKYKNRTIKKDQVESFNRLNIDMNLTNREKKWFKKYELLKEFMSDNSNNLPNKNIIYKNERIGAWVNALRSIYFNGTKNEDGSIRYKSYVLTKEQIELLDGINLFRKKGNINNSSNEKWEENYNEFLEYLNNNDYPTKNNPKLFNWICTQKEIKKRLLYDESIKNSNKYHEYLERIKKLDSIGFEWNKKRKEDKWEENYNLYIEYINKNNTLEPKYGQIYKGVDLNNWVSLQRTIFNNGVKLSDGRIKYRSWILTKERIGKLESINFNWVKRVKKYNKEVITKDNYEQKKRLLLLKLERLLLEDKKEFSTKKEVEALNYKLLKRI